MVLMSLMMVFIIVLIMVLMMVPMMVLMMVLMMALMKAAEGETRKSDKEVLEAVITEISASEKAKVKNIINFL